jgi:parallel beta-helix repeat protein
MTPVVTGTAATAYNKGTILTDTGQFATASRGMLVRTVPVCRGSGTSVTSRAVCTGATKGDGCACTVAGDCLSGVCEARFAIVEGKNDANNIVVNEWASDVDRLPVGAPEGLSGVASSYTLYSWVVCQAASYTATSITCGSGTQFQFRDWLGTAVTPAAGTLYEVMRRHPNYPILGSAAQPVVRTRVDSELIQASYSDAISLFGTENTVTNSVVQDGWDHGINIQGAYNTVNNNRASHQGVRGSPASRAAIRRTTTTWRTIRPG